MTDKLYELSFCGKRIFNHDRRCTYNVTLRGVRITIVAAEKQLSINYYYCVCPYSCLSYPACKSQIASILRRIIVPSVACLALPCLFPIIS